MKLKPLAKLITPPIIISFLKAIVSKQNPFFREYEYIPSGWLIAKSDPKIKGWNVDSILDAYKKNWKGFEASIQGTSAFGLSPESHGTQDFDIIYHNTLMVFAYALALASRQKHKIRMLDWGGGIGHYYLLSRVLLSDLEIDYLCKDVPILADYGQKLFPETRFISDESYLQEQFDFMLASGSLHYVENWQSVFIGFKKCLNGYLLITRLPVTLADDDYVFVQRPYRYDYDTEYLGWAVSRKNLLDIAKQAGFRLVREFITGEKPNIHGAPGSCEYRGYLFVGEQENRDLGGE